MLYFEDVAECGESQSKYMNVFSGVKNLNFDIREIDRGESVRSRVCDGAEVIF